MTRPEPSAIMASDVPARSSTGYPTPFAASVAGRSKRALGDIFGLSNFGVNLTTLAPGSQSSVRHRHLVQDEFVYVLVGEVVLIDDSGQTVLTSGMCAGFPHGGSAHHLVNRSGREAVYLEIGDRLAGDSADYPDDDLVAERVGDGWRFLHKSGEPY
jgi:uncharacterized cupin superfamily protein